VELPVGSLASEIFAALLELELADKVELLPGRNREELLLAFQCNAVPG
jgi:hypothetical protein